jgi:hypothetical protein
MTTRFCLSESVSVAFDFAHKLMNGLLNLQTDDFSEELTRAVVSLNEPFFKTKPVEDLRFDLEDYRLSRFEIDDSETDPESLWSASERRVVRVFALPRDRGKEEQIATFIVHRAYLDGERAEGWTRWSVKRVVVTVSGISTTLHKHHVDRDEAPLWGVSITS